MTMMFGRLTLASLLLVSSLMCCQLSTSVTADSLPLRKLQPENGDENDEEVDMSGGMGGGMDSGMGVGTEDTGDAGDAGDEGMEGMGMTNGTMTDADGGMVEVSPTTAPKDAVSPTTAPKDAASPTTAPKDAASPTSAPMDEVSPTSAPTDEVSPTSAPKDGAGGGVTESLSASPSPEPSLSSMPVAGGLDGDEAMPSSSPTFSSFPTPEEPDNGPVGDPSGNGVGGDAVPVDSTSMSRSATTVMGVLSSALLALTLSTLL